MARRPLRGRRRDFQRRLTGPKAWPASSAPRETRRSSSRRRWSRSVRGGRASAVSSAQLGNRWNGLRLQRARPDGREQLLQQERQRAESLASELSSARDAAKQQQVALEQERSRREGLSRELGSAREQVERLTAAEREAKTAENKMLQQERQRAESLAASSAPRETRRSSSRWRWSRSVRRGRGSAVSSAQLGNRWNGLRLRSARPGRPRTSCFSRNASGPKAWPASSAPRETRRSSSRWRWSRSVRRGRASAVNSAQLGNRWNGLRLRSARPGRPRTSCFSRNAIGPKA